MATQATPRPPTRRTTALRRPAPRVRRARCRPPLSQGRGECSGYYMDYFACIDKCSTKVLFKELV
jgi:hypothetical protein